MGKEAPNKRKKKNMEQPIPNIQQWISNMVKGVSRQHLEGMAAASAVFITFFFFVYKNRKERWATKRGTYHRSMTLGALHGGRVAMQRILDAQHARVDASVLDSAQADLSHLLGQTQLNFVQIQNVVAKLEMSGKEDKALEMLSKALEDANKLGDLHKAYELDMLITEMLIYKGNYVEALDRECLTHQEITDARRPLFKTILQIMLGHRRLAQECWKEFRAIRSLFQSPDSLHNGPLHAVSQDYDKFENAVKLLKKEIDAVHNRRPS